ncbi:hypothetical protein Xen7305DRAFT_00052210 [Xenococcus sp. PCC 7305]|uniref:hypothetical protein n=1 Tax=Xenococcus sp. PCC 7305 TaxID=102125 RepID=UPI0002AC2DB0|nr:hypothetical protein [Xenococcus sp. PCC 7305]ELS05476.1 hypothetical protein Xen7305DRAFT_00052210 [Xenococcus sp. PCC 7305]
MVFGQPNNHLISNHEVFHINRAITLQLDAAGAATVNGAAFISGIANRMVAIYNKGNAWYAI